MLNRRQSMLFIPGFAIAQSASAFDLGGALGAVKNAGSAMSLSDADIRGHAKQMASQMDAQAPIAPSQHPQARRLAALTSSCREDQGLALNYKVYLTREVNAFALADGSIRMYSGLMDMMTDDEIRYVIGHEIGHVHAGHTKKRMQMAFGTNAARHAAIAAGGKAGAIAGSDLGDLVTKVVKAQHSQSNENEADDYAMGFLSRRHHNRKAAVTALEKLDALSGGGQSSWLSTHPAPRDRANRMRQQA
ncbi:MAG TPA: M48 family metalloprotease [Burkholderiaceae bacterium]|nr:M48 family metalloprotease [Burkholderiaceae bacterium]